MSSLRNPVGPLPPSVYWRRRLLVIAGLLAVVVVVLLIVFRPGVPDAAETPLPTDSSTPSGAPDDEAAGGGTGDSAACAPSAIELTPVTDSASYGPENLPQLSMTITNTSASACTIDGGTDAQVYVIWSGTEANKDVIWRSTDCQEGATSVRRELQAGESVSTTPFSWDRTRSSESTCGGNRPQVAAGGASYHLEVSLGDAESEDSKQFLLN